MFFFANLIMGSFVTALQTLSGAGYMLADADYTRSLTIGEVTTFNAYWTEPRKPSKDADPGCKYSGYILPIAQTWDIVNPENPSEIKTPANPKELIGHVYYANRKICQDGMPQQVALTGFFITPWRKPGTWPEGVTAPVAPLEGVKTLNPEWLPGALEQLAPYLEKDRAEMAKVTQTSAATK